MSDTSYVVMKLSISQEVPNDNWEVMKGLGAEQIRMR